MAWLDNARILATLAVILLHVAGSIVVDNVVGTEIWWFGNIYDSISRWCVPVFVMISGALLLQSNKEEGLLPFYKKRLSRVLLPMLFWSIFFSFWSAFKESLNGNSLTFRALAMNLVSGNPYYHMWFLYMIIGLYLFTPFFRKVVIHSTQKDISFLVRVGLTLAAINFSHEFVLSKGTTLPTNWFLPYIPYYFLGHTIRNSKASPSLPLLWTTFFLSFLATVIGCYVTTVRTDLATGLYFYGYFSISVIPMAISLMHILKRWERPLLSAAIARKLSRLTLGIYLIHPVILEIIKDKGNAISGFHPSISIPAISLIVFFLSICASWSISRIPFLSKLI